MQLLVIQLSKGSISEIEEFESKEEDNVRFIELDVNDPRHIHCDET